MSSSGPKEHLRSQSFTDLEAFKARSDLIITNRKTDELDDVESKLFTRDIFGEN